MENEKFNIDRCIDLVLEYSLFHSFYYYREDAVNVRPDCKDIATYTKSWDYRGRFLYEPILKYVADQLEEYNRDINIDTEDKAYLVCSKIIRKLLVKLIRNYAITSNRMIPDVQESFMGSSDEDAFNRQSERDGSQQDGNQQFLMTRTLSITTKKLISSKSLDEAYRIAYGMEALGELSSYNCVPEVEIRVNLKR